jgi:DNA excision repair protein ERCC-5
MALSAIAARYSPKKLVPLTTRPVKSKASKPLFDLDVDDEDAEAIRQAIDQMEDVENAEVIRQAMEQFEDDEDQALAFAIQKSLDQTKLGSHSTPPRASSSRLSRGSPKSLDFPSARRPAPEVDIFTPSGLETALAFAGTGSPDKKVRFSMSGTQDGNKASFGVPSLLSSSLKQSPNMVSKIGENIRSQYLVPPVEGSPASASTPSPLVISDSEDDDMEEVDVSIPTASKDKETAIPVTPFESEPAPDLEESEGEDDMEEVETVVPRLALPVEEPQVPPSLSNSPKASPEVIPPLEHNKAPLFVSSRSSSPVREDGPTAAWEDLVNNTLSTVDVISHEPDYEPEVGNSRTEVVDEEEPWDAAHEIDPHAEEGEFARFLSQVKGRNLNDVQKEIDDEIKVLNDQRKAAMRDSEDITQQMISQIMVSYRYINRSNGCLIEHYSTDDVEVVWYTLYHSTDGSRGTMRGTGILRSR